MNFRIITLFPESFDSYIHSSIIGRALTDKKIKIKFYNPRDYTKDKHRRVDQRPYGGGPGMVLEPLSLTKTIEKAIKDSKTKPLIIWLTPSGQQFDNSSAEKIAKKYREVIIICGRYEGIDERVQKIFKAQKVSIGPFVITGGELAGMIILDTVARRIPGVLGKIESVEENRISASAVYTRPETFVYKGKNYRVPKVLLSGNHKKINEWKQRK
jgi:tRNA (guanine37-N1)-methyltransferase